MRPRALVIGLLVLAPIALAGEPAVAKGASRATITGPRIEPIRIGQRGNEDIYTLARLTGLFPTVFETEPQKVLDEKPTGRLGRRYDVAYVFKAERRRSNIVHQDLYPYARGGPVTHVAPGQPTFGRGARSVGGWFRAGPRLLPYLVEKGLPVPKNGLPAEDSGTEVKDDGEAAAAAEPPAPRPSPERSDTPWATGALIGGAALVLLAAIVQRRRWRSARSAI